jgi:hypothetical protein
VRRRRSFTTIAVAVVVVAGAAVWASGTLQATAGSPRHPGSRLVRAEDRPRRCEFERRCRSSRRGPEQRSGPTTPNDSTSPTSPTSPPDTTVPDTTPPTTDPATTTTTTSTSTEPATTTTTTAPPASTSSWWSPPLVVEWQWELDHPLNLASASDMGTGVATYLGTPAADPTVYDIDGFDNPASTVSALHAAGDHVICYIEVGAAENYRPDYSEFPTADLGAVMDGYPDERYLNINDPAVVQVIEARISMCASKGFDAIEPDIDDSYTDSTGFPITESENVAYDATLAAYAHSLGLGWALKNGDDPSFAAAVEPVADFVIDEQCHQYDTCASFAPFVSAGKAVLEVEYSLPADQFCPAANAADEDAMEMNVDLNGGRLPCR